MECPSCNSYRLKPTKLDFGLPARICSKCNGILINLLTYRSWLETVPETLQAEPKAEIFAEDNDKALTCKKCKRIMLKYKISSETINHVDLCTHCDDAWLDYGEWNMLKHLKLHKDLAKIFTEPWQQKLIKQIEKKNYEARFLALLGAEE